jgi:hypothetical protein
VLAEGSSSLNVVVIEGDDAVDRPFSSEVTDGIDRCGPVVETRHSKKLIDALSGPLTVLEALDGDKDDAAAPTLGLAQELVPLFVRGKAKHCEGTLLLVHRHHPSLKGTLVTKSALRVIIRGKSRPMAAAQGSEELAI